MGSALFVVFWPTSSVLGGFPRKGSSTGLVWDPGDTRGLGIGNLLTRVSHRIIMGLLRGYVWLSKLWSLFGSLL